MIIDQPEVTVFFEGTTKTVTSVVRDPMSHQVAIIDAVLDFDYTSGRTQTTSADTIITYIKNHGYQVEWILETHAHADHLSAASYIQKHLGGAIGIGERIQEVQKFFADFFGESTLLHPSSFDHLFRDEERFMIGSLEAQVIFTPGHTPACVSYSIGDALFVGDTLFMPDFGTARCDFPGGSAQVLYRSIQKLLKFPDETRMFVGHDYQSSTRDYYAWETTVGAQRQSNIHVNLNQSELDFIKLRQARDTTLSIPKLLIPAIQVNLRAGHLPEPDERGQVFLKVPINVL